MPAIHFLCRACERRLAADDGSDPGVGCDSCGVSHALAFPPAGAPLERCGSCGERELYVQKDFNRTTGIVLVAIGAVFVPWTWGLSLLAVTILDFALYSLLGDVTVCYACRAVHRGFPRNPAHGAFDLVTHDRHVYGVAPPGAEEGHR
ncbi:MAG TPA: hypothetical protein VMS56_03795 [Thermoanaerobaculia bacterium]|nr:hypothetical protein [Thermoanaerobaculia bacterium]